MRGHTVRHSTKTTSAKRHLKSANTLTTLVQKNSHLKAENDEIRSRYTPRAERAGQLAAQSAVSAAASEASACRRCPSLGPGPVLSPWQVASPAWASAAAAPVSPACSALALCAEPLAMSRVAPHRCTRCALYPSSDPHTQASTSAWKMLAGISRSERGWPSYGTLINHARAAASSQVQREPPNSTIKPRGASPPDTTTPQTCGLACTCAGRHSSRD
jgi:hypothetical protein